MHSGIYEGRVCHRRFAPVRHDFQYRLFLMYLDLTELDEIFAGRWFWSTSRTAWARYRRDDHWGDPAVPLDVAIRDLVEARIGKRPGGPIRLLTQLRHFGYAMNPACFYYCFDASGGCVESVVAEVTNTPWGERHCYVLPRVDLPCGALRFRHGKEFHVSPFMAMDLQYSWRLGIPGKRLTVHIDSIERGLKLFDATLMLERHEITGGRLARLLLQYPFMTGRVFAAIYWQALRLWLKKCPFYPHPRPRLQQKVTTS